MMFALRRLLILGVIVLVGYCVWPRTPSLAAFQPARIADLQLSIWQKARAGQRGALGTLLYKLYVGQYGIAPLTALKMASETADALTLFHAAPDAADQEKAIPPLVAAFTTLQDRTHAPFDSNAAAQMEFQIWSLRANGNSPSELTSALSEQMALLYGKSPEACLPVSKKFAAAMKAADAGRWAEARPACREAWSDLKALIKQP